MVCSSREIYLRLLRQLNKKYAAKLMWENRGSVYHLEEISMAYRNMYDYLSGLCLKEDPNSILEYGCGYGYLLKKIADRNNNSKKMYYYGIDYSSEQILHAKNYFKEAEFIVADLTKPLSSIKDNFFDVVIGVGVLMYIQPRDINKAISELYRLCKKKIMVVEYYYKYLNPAKQHAYKRAIRHDCRCIYDYSSLLEQVGFRNIQVVQMEFFYDPYINTLNEMPQTLIVADK